MSSGFFVEILAEDEVEAVTPPPSSMTDIEIVISHATTVDEAPGPVAVEIGTGTVTQAYVDSHGLFVDPAAPADPTRWAAWVDTS